MPSCWIIAGPNGAGKTPFALEYLPRVAGCTHFINADLIAAGLSPLAPERELVAASRILLQEIEDIERRFARSLRNLLNDYSQAANRTRCFMNADDQPAPVFELQGNVLSIFNQDPYQHLVKEAGL